MVHTSSLQSWYSAVSAKIPISRLAHMMNTFMEKKMGAIDLVFLCIFGSIDMLWYPIRLLRLAVKQAKRNH